MQSRAGDAKILPMNGLLEGVRALDLTHYFAGPYCTRLLAGLGAEVVKVERPPLGDPLRGYGPFASRPAQAKVGPSAGVPIEDGAWHLYLNAGKRSIGLDIKTDEGRDTLLQLAAKADVLVENFAPGALGRLGLGYEELRQVNPALVVTSISNFGQTGPYRDWKAAEVNLYAMGGLMNITGEPDREPLKEGAPLAQLGAGQNAFVATMAALMYAEETGEGQQVDISIAEYATNILENALMQYSYSGQEYTRVGNRGYGRAAWGIYPCGDGFVGIIAGPDHRWPEVARIMEREELADPRFASRRGRQDNADEVDALMLPWLIEHDKVDIFKAGQESGLGVQLCRHHGRHSRNGATPSPRLLRRAGAPSGRKGCDILAPLFLASLTQMPGFLAGLRCTQNIRAKSCRAGWDLTQPGCRNWRLPAPLGAVNADSYYKAAAEELPHPGPVAHLGRALLHQADGRPGG